MLSRPRSRRSVFAVARFAGLAAFAAVFSALTVRATDGTWSTTNQTGSWDNSGNWSGGTIADGADATATFGPVTFTTDGGDAYISLESSRTIGQLVFGRVDYYVDEDNNGSLRWYIDNNGDSENVLTLAGSVPSISVAQHVEMSAILAGTSGFTKTGSGNLVLKLANVYSGTTYLTQGSLTAANLESFGSSSVVVSGSSSTLSLNAQGTFTNAITLGAGTILQAAVGSGHTATVGDLTLTGAAILKSSFGDTLQVNGAIGGAYSLTLGNSSPSNTVVSFTGSSANTYSGTTTLNSGNLVLGKSTGVTAVAGDLTLGNSSNTVALRLDASHQIADTSAVTVTKNATFNVNGQTETIGSLAGSHPTSFVTLGSGALTVGANNTSTSFAGAISGTGSFTKIGSGTLTLSGASSHTGGTTISAGKLDLDSPNTLQSATGTLTVSGGTLATSVGNSTIGSDLTFTSGSIDIGGTNAGRLTLASGKTFAMSGGTLTLTLGSSFDTIYSNGSGTLSLTGGVIALDTSGAGFSYGSTYQVFSGFGSASFASLTLSGYDTGSYTASFSNSGLLSFTASAVPEPATCAALAGFAALGLAAWRRRQAARPAPTA